MRHSNYDAELIADQGQRLVYNSQTLKRSVDHAAIIQERQPAKGACQRRNPEWNENEELDQDLGGSGAVIPGVGNCIGHDRRKACHDEANPDGSQEHRLDNGVGEDPGILGHAGHRESEAPAHDPEKRKDVNYRQKQRKRGDQQ